MMVSLPRAEVNAPENRRPSCLSIVIVNAILLSRGPAAGAAEWCALPGPITIDSLSPFQVPRRLGMADSAAAGVTENTANVTIQASFDMTDPPPGELYRRLIGGGQYRERALPTRIRAPRRWPGRVRRQPLTISGTTPRPRSGR